jgi:DNA-binding transcriptional LysR family regulator
LGKSLVSKDSEADGSHRSGTKTLYSNCWCDEKLESIPHKNSTAETPQTIRIGTPQKFFTHRLLGQLPQDDRTFYTVQFWLTAELIQQLKAGKLGIVIATQKITLSDIEYELLFEDNFWLVGPPNAIVPISEGISQADLNPLSQWLLTQPWIAYSEELPSAPAFGPWCLAE